MKLNTIIRRFLAYFIDIIIITCITSAITYLDFINPKYDEYLKYSDKYTDVSEKYFNKEITIEEFSDEVRGLSYNLNKNGAVYLATDIAVAVLYFGIFAFATKGQTLGKKLMKLKIVSNKDKELKLYNYLLRTVLLYGIILNIFTLIAICFKESTYRNIYTIGSNIDSILLIIIVLMILFNKKARGLHDYLAGTKVIDLKETEKVGE